MVFQNNINVFHDCILARLPFGSAVLVYGKPVGKLVGEMLALIGKTTILVATTAGVAVSACMPLLTSKAVMSYVLGARTTQDL